MRGGIAVVLSLTLGGCAAHRPHVADRPDRPSDWASVAAIPHRAPVRATLRYDIDGNLDEVTDSTLSIRVPPDGRRLTMSRDQVVRVAILVPKKMRWAWLHTPLAVGAVTGLGGALVGAVMRDGKVAAISLGIFAACSTGFFYHYVHHRFDHEWRVVYVRP
jgi:hypothetical protein